MRIKGRVKWFNTKKGYGFISREDGSGDVFVHWTGIKGEGFKTLNEGEEVEFEEQADQKGVKAINVVRLKPQVRKPSGRRKFSKVRAQERRKF